MWPQQQNTEQLLAAAREGDGDAVNELMNRHRDALRRLVGMRLDRKIQRRVDVSDIVQDVLLDAGRRLDDYLANPVMPFHLWLRHMAKDRIIDAHRRHRASAKRSVDREQQLAVPRGNDQSTIQLAAQLLDRETTPAAAATMQELARRFQSAIEQLEEQDREVVIMRHFEQLTNGETAIALGITQPAASMRYLRAMRKLRELIGENAQE